jgi:hypothetical protein
MAVNIRKWNACLVIGAVGLAAGAPMTAVAGDDMTVSLSGGAMQSDFTRAKLGEPSDVIADDFGMYGSVEVLRGISPGWDWSASATVLAFAPNSFNNLNIDGGPPPFASSTSDFDAGIANLDIGRKWETSRTSLRLGVGVEALSTSDDTVLSFFDESFSLDGDASQSYVGAGLRLSAEGKSRLAADSPFSVYGGASMAATRGQYDKGLTLSASNDDPDQSQVFESGAFSESKRGGMNHGALEVGLEYAPTSSTAFRVGLRRDVFKVDSDTANDFEFFESTVEADTAYVGVAISF